MNEQERIFKRFDDGTSYLIAFVIAFSILLIGASLFMLPMMIIGAQKEGLTLIEYANNSELILIHSFVAQLVSQILAIGVLGYFFFSIYKKDFLKFIKFKKNWIFYIVIIVGFGVLYGMNYFFEWLYPLIGIEEGTSTNQEIIISALKSDSKIFVILATVITASIFEEMVFRKFLYGFFKNKTKLPVWVIVLIISVFFAGLHVVSDLDSLIYFPIYFCLALVITSAYAFTKENIIVVTGLHFLNNLCSVLMVFF